MDFDSKLRPLYLLKIFQDRTDENHPLSTAQLCAILKNEYGIDTFRTTLRSDVEALQKAGFKIKVTRSAQNMYHWAERSFAPTDLAMLIDIVKSSKLIGEECKKALAFQLAAQAGPEYENLLQRTPVLHTRGKPGSEQIQDAVKTIRNAINDRKKIRFQPGRYNIRKEMIPLGGGEDIILSPNSVVCDGERYYVLGFSESSQLQGGYRLDRMLNCPEEMDEEAASPPEALDVSAFYTTEFRMEGASIEEVELQVDNSLMDNMLDRFGLDVTTYACNQYTFRLVVNVFTSASFYGWVFSHGGKVKIRKPDHVLREYEAMLIGSLL